MGFPDPRLHPRVDVRSNLSPSIVERGAIHPDTQILWQIHPKQLHFPSLHAKVSHEKSTRSEGEKTHLDALVLDFS